jgi:hypothetical protein
VFSRPFGVFWRGGAHSGVEALKDIQCVRRVFKTTRIRSRWDKGSAATAALMAALVKQFDRELDLSAGDGRAVYLAEARAQDDIGWQAEIHEVERVEELSPKLEGE